jgi:hypothetical protein
MEATRGCRVVQSSQYCQVTAPYSGAGAGHPTPGPGLVGDGMQIEIMNSPQTTGIFSKKTEYRVYLKIDFTEEEKAIIKERSLASHVLFVSPTEYGALDCTLAMVLKGSTSVGRRFADPLEAIAFEKKLLETILPELKSLIEISAVYTPRTRTFEL